MKKYIIFNNIVLIFLTITVLWLVNKTDGISYEGRVYVPNTDGGFTLIKTDYGGFPVLIDKTKPVEDGTELSFILINPFNIHFGDAKISVGVNGTVESIRMDLLPSVNRVKFNVPFIERGQLIEIKLSLNRIYFK